MTFRLQTFGDLLLLAPDGAPVPFPDKGLAAICHLFAADRDDVRRASLARLLWESDDDRPALVNLRKTISRIVARQNEIGTEFLKITADRVMLDRGSLDCDLAGITRIAAAEPMRRLEQYLDLFSRPFLDATRSPTAMFTDWIDRVRGDHAAILLDAFRSAAPVVATAGDAETMRKAAVTLLRANPADGDIHRLLMATFAAGGEPRAILAIREAGRDASWTTGPGVAFTPSPVRVEAARLRVEARPKGAAGRQGSGSGEPPVVATLPRVALLPPTEVGSVGSVSAVAELLLQDITIGLSSERSLRVVAPFSCARLSRSADKVALIRKHAITYFLDTCLSAADGYSIFARLIHIADDAVVWAGRFSLKATDLPSQRQDIARRVTMSVVGFVHRNDLAAGYLKRNPVAYHHYLIGQHHLQNLTLGGIRRARRQFKAALEDDRHFSPALSGLARSHSGEWLLTARGNMEHLRTSEKYANQAIAAGQGLAAGYRELGVTKLYLGDLDESIAALEIAGALSPHYADVVADHADALVFASRPAEGLERIEQAIDLNPLCPDLYHWTAASANYQLEHYEEALASISRMENPTPAARLSAATWAMLGDQKKARFFVRKVREAHPDFDVDEWLKVVPIRDQKQKDHYREGLLKAGF